MPASSTRAFCPTCGFIRVSNSRSRKPNVHCLRGLQYIGFRFEQLSCEFCKSPKLLHTVDARRSSEFLSFQHAKQVCVSQCSPPGAVHTRDALVGLFYGTHNGCWQYILWPLGRVGCSASTPCSMRDLPSHLAKTHQPFLLGLLQYSGSKDAWKECRSTSTI